MKKILLNVALMVLGTSVISQDLHKTLPEPTEKCGIISYQDKLFEEHPEWREQQEKEQQEFQQFYEDFMESWSPDDRAIYIIPVVVHVIHEGGSENISDAQIYDAIKQLNEDYSATNEDVVDAVSPFDALVADMDIEFRLAGLDNEGNCTKGITRTYSSLTNGGSGGAVASLVESEQGLWPQNKYMNVFIQADLDGPAGYTNYPSGWYDEDGMSGGIYLRANYMGSIGTSSEYREHTLSHEAGHWLNLRHLWGNSNSPTDPENCDEDDEVTDTPNTIGWSSCDLGGESCGSTDNVQNFLEYSYCSCMFTTGQKARVHAALNSSTAGRDNLWTSSNLSATGVDGILCEADFSVDENLICGGSSVEFSDFSYHQVTSRLWTFEGGTPSTSTDENPVVTYDTPGNYDVTLEVFNGAEEKTLTRSSYISVFDNSGTDLPYMQGFEDLNSIFDENSFALVNENDGETWALTDEYAHLSGKSIWLNNYENDDGSKDVLISETIDLSTVPVEEDFIFSFDYSYIKKYADNDEYLKVFVSKDCGESWALRLILDSDEMTESVDSTPYYALYDGWWRHEVITTISDSYHVENFMYKFEFTNNNGNNLFLDNINIYPDYMTDVEETKTEDLNIYPNPTDEILYIKSLGVKTFRIQDMTGRTILQGNYNGMIDLTRLSSGMYQVIAYDIEGKFLGTERLVKR